MFTSDPEYYSSVQCRVTYPPAPHSVVQLLTSLTASHLRSGVSGYTTAGEVSTPLQGLYRPLDQRVDYGV